MKRKIWQSPWARRWRHRPSAPGTVTVLTSFPQGGWTTAYKKAFEAANPGITVEILNKKHHRVGGLRARTCPEGSALT